MDQRRLVQWHLFLARDQGKNFQKVSLTGSIDLDLVENPPQRRLIENRIRVEVGRKNHTRIYFDRDWKEQEFSIKKPKAKIMINRPKNFESMLKLADQLSLDFEFIRVDLYTNENEIYVGELTNWPENGKGYFVPPESEITASRLLFDD